MIRSTASTTTDGRYIRLDSRPAPNIEVRDSGSDCGPVPGQLVRAVTGEAYSEEKFLQVKALIERFRVAPGTADQAARVDPRVTDVRQLVRVLRLRTLACRRTSNTRTTPARAASRGGRRRSWPTRCWLRRWHTSSSLDWRRRRPGPSASSSSMKRSTGVRSLDPLRPGPVRPGLGLQLLIVTPLQKIHVIEPYVVCGRFR